MTPTRSGTTQKALCDQGWALYRSGRIDEAKACYKKVLLRDPKHFDALYLLGMACAQSGQGEVGIALLKRSIAVNPSSAAAHALLGDALLALDRPSEAVASCEKATWLQPDLAYAHNNRGLALMRLGRAQEALESFERVGALIPGVAEAHYNRGNALSALQRHTEAVASFDQAIALQPGMADAYLNRGVSLGEMNRSEDALASFERGLALDPGSADAHSNRGHALSALRRHQDALASYDRAIASEPNHVDARFGRSMILLSLGQFEAGWREYEWRKRKPPHTAHSINQMRPWPEGADLAGKTILLRHEQGLGDMIQFCRYVRLLEDRGAEVVLSAPGQLQTVLRTLSPTARIIGQAEPPPPFDYENLLMSLPLAFNTVLESIPADIPYLGTEPSKVAYWGDRLGEKANPRVGLVWSGGFRPDRPDVWAVNRRRNIPFQQMARLSIDGVDFFSLQKGDPAETELLLEKQRYWPGRNLFNFASELNDFSDTAALIEHLDLVISVDTSVAHLAAAMGKPVWILNRFDACWRWLFDRHDSPWYPTVRLFRQPSVGDWASVIETVRAELHSALFESAHNPVG